MIDSSDPFSTHPPTTSNSSSSSSPCLERGIKEHVSLYLPAMYLIFYLIDATISAKRDRLFIALENDPSIFNPINEKARFFSVGAFFSRRYTFAIHCLNLCELVSSLVQLIILSSCYARLASFWNAA